MSIVEYAIPSLRRNAAVSLAGRALSVALWIAVTPYVLAQLGAERFGIWSLFFAVTAYAATVDLGVGSSVPRFVARCVALGDRAGARDMIRRSLLVSGGAGLAWAAACAAGRDLFVNGFHVPDLLAGEVRTSLSLFAISLLVFSLNQALQGALVGLQRFDLSNLTLIAGLLVNTAVLVAGLSAGLGLLAAAIGSLVGPLISAILASTLLGKALNALDGSGESATRISWREFLAFGGSVQFTNVCVVGQIQAGKVLLGLLGGLAWVTQYELGFRVAYAVWSVPTLAWVVTFPAVAHAHVVEGDQGVREIYAWCCRWVFVLAGWLLGGLWVTAPVLFRLWLGPGHEEAVRTARILALAFGLASMAGPASIVARGMGWPRLEAAYFGLALVLNVALALPLIRTFGTLGAAAATAVSFAVAGAWLLIVFHRRLGMSNLKWLSQVALPRLFPAAAVAMLLSPLAARLPDDTRAGAFGAVVAAAAAFTLLHGLLLLPLGDPQALWLRGQAWLARSLAQAATKRSA